MTIESKQTQKGFTLIELMIVVAIIGILASIAIPQFSSFRQKAFNSSAIADLHATSLAEEGLFTDYQKYGGSVKATGTAGASAGALLSAAGFVATDVAGQEMPINISTNVTVLSNMNAGFTAATSIAKHASGDKAYGQETDQSGVYFLVSKAAGVITAANAGAAKAAAKSGDVAGVSAVLNALDLTAGAGLWTQM